MSEPGALTDGLRIDPGRSELAFDGFREACRRGPDRIAIIYLGTRFSYGMMGEAVDRFAAALAGLGVAQGDRVMLYLPNTPQWVIANFAAQRLGAVVVPVSPIYTAHELAHMVRDAGVRTVVCMDSNFGYVHEAARTETIDRIIWTGLADLLPWWKRAAGHLLDRIPRGSVAREPRVFSFRRLLDRARGRPPEVAIDAWRDLATIHYTGGTTGRPKGVPGNHMTEAAYVRDVGEDVLGPHLRPGEDVLLMVAPLYHIMPKGFFYACGLNPGNATVLMPFLHTDSLLDAIGRHGVRWLLGVPSLFRKLLDNDRLDQYELQTLRHCYCGGDVLPEEVFRRWRERIGAPIRQVYGATEVGHVAYGLPDEELHPSVVGLPLKSYRIAVVRPGEGDALEAVPPGETGELLVTADFTFKSYWNRPEETARCFVRMGGETWYRTGDFVRLDEAGRICFVERSADLIKHKGFRVAASEVEAVLQDHPSVVGACVVGVEDEAVGERVKAIVVLREGVRGVSGPELKRWCRERLAEYKTPDYIEFRDMLPKSKVGKLLRREIRDEERRKAGKPGLSGVSGASGLM